MARNTQLDLTLEKFEFKENSTRILSEGKKACLNHKIIFLYINSAKFFIVVW
jgi:hypothetical protein